MINNNHLTVNEVKDLAVLHHQTLTDSLLTQMGISSLVSYYTFIQSSKEEILFVKKESNEIVSSAVLSFKPASLNRRFLASTLILSLSVLLVKSISNKKIRNHLIHYQKTSALPKSCQSLPEVVQIFTSPKFQGQNHGRSLINQIETFLKSNNFHRYFVKTRNEPDNPAKKFYERLNFSAVDDPTHESQSKFSFFIKEF